MGPREQHCSEEDDSGTQDRNEDVRGKGREQDLPLAAALEPKHSSFLIKDRDTHY